MTRPRELKPDDLLLKIKALLEKGPMCVYKISKELRITYGAAQYYVTKGEILGLWKTAKVGQKTVVYLPGQDPTSAATVKDIIICIQRHADPEEPAVAIYKYLEMCVEKRG